MKRGRPTPQPPTGPPPRGGMAPARGGPSRVGQASSIYQRAPEMEEPVEAAVPSFMGAASRKRKWEIAAERGLVPPIGHSQSGPGFVAPTPGYFGGGGPGPGPAVAGRAAPSQKKGLAAQGGGKGNGKTSAGKGAAGQPWVPASRAAGGGKAAQPPRGPPPGKVAKPAYVEEEEDTGIEEEFDLDVGGAITPPRPSRGGAKRQQLPAPAPKKARAAAPRAAAQATPRAEVPAGEVGGVKWLTISAESAFVQAGLPDLAPAVWQDPGLQDLLSSAQHILAALDVDISTVTFSHDTEWKDHPDIGEAIKATGGEELCFCVVECPEMAMWAVGVANSWKKREQAARLALCVAVAANLSDFEKLAAEQPEFTAFCESVGVSTGSNLPPFSPAVSAVATADDDAAPVKSRAKGPSADGGGRGLAQATPAAEAPLAAGHRDRPFWINLLAGEEAIPDALESMAPEAVVLTTLGTGRKGLYGKAEAALAALVEDPAADIVYHDDPNWELFPTVGNAVKAITGTEECQTVAVCVSLNVWAVGVGMKGKNRFMAAKAALATAIALQNVETGTEVNYEEFSSLQEVVEEAAEARLEV